MAVFLYLRPRLLLILLLGFASGLPLALTASTLGVWLTEAGVSKSAIGLFAAVATPYTLKFFWSPLIDGIRLPLLARLLGRRRSWMLATQLALMASIAALGFADPAIDPWMTALFALFVATLSASQDIVIDAYRVEILAPQEQGAGAAMAVLGYRFGMIASSAGALYLAAYAGWQMTYLVMAALAGLMVIATLLAPEPSVDSKPLGTQRASVSSWLVDHVADPFADFMRRPQWFAIILFILLYKLADAFMGVMTNPFLIELGFAKEDIATVVKLYGVIATIIGSFIGGAMVARFSTARTLMICGIAHGLTNLMFVVQAKAGADMHVLALSITLENISGGMGLAAFVAFLSGLTHVHYTATQYALLSSLSAFGRTWLSTPAGWFAEKLGWEMFFVFASALAIPGLLVLYWLTKHKGAISSYAPLTPEMK